ncbi:HK97 gp10 family phage protein [Tepidanaerobacter syntrophicus]|uniref:HK97 gp10 family phage protein n=1 Tax=Tepidanaerobacter syntrophicus TaxID=224999 RepID=UPI001BD6B576|nr:HK97 gp10 family phage protein [Tepidanaerobacter syntrophicus]
MKINEVTTEIERALKEYTEDVEQGIEEVIKADVTAAVKELKNTSPKKTGEYAKGWTFKKESTQGEVKYTIYNKTKPQLTHLLEFGHAKRAGGRVAGKPHIAPVEEKLNQQVVQDIEAVIKGGRP